MFRKFVYDATYHRPFCLVLKNINEVCKHIVFILGNGFVLIPIAIRCNVFAGKWLTPPYP